MSFGAGMKFRNPFRPKTRNIRPNRIRTMAVTMRPADFPSRPCVSTVCDAVSVMGFSFKRLVEFNEVIFALVNIGSAGLLCTSRGDATTRRFHVSFLHRCSYRSFCKHHVQCGGTRHMLGAFVSQLQQVNSMKETFTAAKDDRRHRDV